jgi:hypothetical protein
MTYPTISLSKVEEEWLHAWLDLGFITQAAYDEEIDKPCLLEKAGESTPAKISGQTVKSEASQASLDQARGFAKMVI